MVILELIAFQESRFYGMNAFLNPARRVAVTEKSAPWEKH